MKKFISSIFLIIMSVLLCVASLSGCAKPNDEDSGKGPSGEGTQEEPSGEETQEEKWKEDGILKILTVGNSFSDDTMEYVWQIADDLGVENIYLGNLFIGGCTLDTHALNAKNNNLAYDYRVNSNGSWKTERYRMGDALSEQNWDFVSLQQASGSSGVKDTYKELGYLVDYVKEKAPSAQIVWNMTWAYQQNSNHSEFYKYNYNQETMYEMIVDSVKSCVITNDNIKIVIPNGTAIQNARTSYIGDTLTRDGYHLSLDFGRYIAGLTLFRALTGISVKEIEFAPAGVSGEYRKIAVEAAENAVKNPFEVTQSEFPTKPTFDPQGYTLLDLELTKFAYYNSDAKDYWDNLITGASNGDRYYASKKFTREDIPVGSVIIIEEGWQYRPEGWEENKDFTTHVRPGNVSVYRVDVTEEWWGNYVTRAFNVSKQSAESLEGKDAEARNALKIYIPN